MKFQRSFRIAAKATQYHHEGMNISVSPAMSLPLSPDLSPASTKAAGALDPEYAWQCVLARDPDAAFVYAVRTTGIFCRPSCPSRRPAPANVEFYQAAADAMAQGFRPCLRCRPLGLAGREDAAFVEQVCDYLLRHLDQAVTLEQLARVMTMKPTTLQKKFRQLTHMTPRQFQIAQRASGFRNLVASPKTPTAPASITDALYDAGYSASSRLYTGASEKLGMTPSRFRDGGRREDIVFVTTTCALGHILVAATAVGICSVALGDSPQLLETELRQRFHQARSLENGADLQSASANLLQQAVDTVLSQLTDTPIASQLPLDLRATVFQQRVWNALSKIPRGRTKSYRDIARELGQPFASRAVARACASNPVALLIPCHRVVGTDGALSGYRWGIRRKQTVLDLESKKESAIDQQ